jgi:hypothetical protein
VGLTVEIGELVLAGFGRVDTDVLVQSFERELTRLLRQRPVTPVGRDAITGLPPLPRTASARQLGVAIARSVHSGLVRGVP